MPDNDYDPLPHLLIPWSAETVLYTSPRRGGGRKIHHPTREREQHADQLVARLNALRHTQEERNQQQQAAGLAVQSGLYLTFESAPKYELKFESLEARASGIELCNMKLDADHEIATVFVPEGKLDILLNKVLAYSDAEKDSPSGKPRHQELVESIDVVKEAALRALWTDSDDLFPATDAEVWWEVWLRVSPSFNFERQLRDYAHHQGLEVDQDSIRFLDRTILLVKATANQLVKSSRILNSFAELRSPKTTAEFFLELGNEDQAAWAANLLGRLQPPDGEPPYVCLLDTGLNEVHMLITPHVTPRDLHSYDNSWGKDDRYGHGTPMAGLALYGDLTGSLESNEPIRIQHRLESVKMIPNPGTHHDPKLYGAVTRYCMAQPEVENPGRRRIYCTGIASLDDRDRGRPSSWSAAVDAICSGLEDDGKRLLLLSAGNTEPDRRAEYPDSNMTDGIHDPGQAWNALTIGAYTDKVSIDPDEYPGWTPLAPSGDVSPSSCTSVGWGSVQWPIKPEIVFEGGNMALEPTENHADYLDSLSVLSTGHRPQDKLFVAFGDSCAAVAQVSRLGGQLMAQYPELWPESVRALLVHSARWTNAMVSRFGPLSDANAKRNLLRWCGFGVPDKDVLMWSASNSLTLIAQESLQPFVKGGASVKTKDIGIS